MQSVKHYMWTESLTQLDAGVQHRRCGPPLPLLLASHTKTQQASTVSTAASAYLIIKLVHGHGGHGVAVGLCPIPMAVLGVTPAVGFRVELHAVLAVAVLAQGHHVHRAGPRRNPGLLGWGWRRGGRGLTVYPPLCKATCHHLLIIRFPQFPVNRDRFHLSRFIEASLNKTSSNG